MTAREFEAALAGLRWSKEKAAAEIGAWLVTGWCEGTRVIPENVANFVKAALQIQTWDAQRDN